MKNPLIVTIEDNKHVEIGDPFILRFNGRYYLYCSTSDDVEGIRCFISNDLVKFEYYGLVAKSPILSHAYAPEVILHNDEFIMCTSPKGNGHYFLKSKSPLGPFEFITDNMHNMIDGSFVMDSSNKLYFLRADHNGIAYLDFENNKLSNRKDILPQISKAWTEGPSMTYFNGYYYITFCGNDVLSPSYRIKMATSKYINKDYKVNSSPLLLSTESGYSGLGHNSVVLGPSLDEYFIAYHKLDWINEHSTTRYLCLDRLYFNLRECACNYSNFEVLSPRRPDFECHVEEKCTLEKVKKFIVSDISTDSNYTCEFNFRGYTDIILSFHDENNYSMISFNDFIEIYDVINGIQILRKKYIAKFNFNHFHSVRIINDIRAELLIDNTHTLVTNKFSNGKCGYVYKDHDLFYIAFTNSTYTESLKKVPHTVPGKIESNYIKTYSTLNYNEDEVYSLTLRKGEEIKINVICKRLMNYKLFARMINTYCMLKITTSKSNNIVEIKPNESEYKFNLRYLTDLILNNNDEISIEVLKGKFNFQYLITEKEIEYNSAIDNKKLDSNDELYLFTPNGDYQEIKFKIKEEFKLNLFGLIVNAKNYSSWKTDKALSYVGYFVGFSNDLLVINYCEYDCTRIYDKPYRLIPGQEYKLGVEVNDNIINVYINNKLEITTSLKYDSGYGLNGVYKSDLSRVKLYDYKEGNYEK